MRLRKGFIFLLVSGFFFSNAPLRAAEPPSDQSKPRKIRVVLNVTPIRIKPLKEGKGVDALEKLPEEMGPSARIVVFRINRVLRGELAKVKTKSLSLWDQAKDAADEKNILKLITMDFHRPEDEGVDKTSFSMAVLDPYASFGIKEGGDIPKQNYKLSLALIHRNPDSYLLIKNEKL
jgi:hypothetical protein